MTKNAASNKSHPRTITLDPVRIIRNDLIIPPLIAEEDGLVINEACESSRERINDTHDRVSVLALTERYAGLLDGITEYSHIIVLYWGHAVPATGRNLEKNHPAGRPDSEEKGIYATCSPARPNPALMTNVRLLMRNGNRLTVSGLDAIDNSPVLDIKQYVSGMFPSKGVRIPGWMEKLMREFRKGRTGEDG